MFLQLSHNSCHSHFSKQQKTGETLNSSGFPGISRSVSNRSHHIPVFDIYSVRLHIETSKSLYSNRDIPVWEPVIWDKFPTLPENIILHKILASSQQKPLYEGIETTLTDDVYHTIANNDLIQIMSNEAAKWNGIKQMLSHFGVSPSAAVYFGDDNDDIEPIKNCGLGVAVSNAIPSVLDVADRVIDSNDMDGVAKFIEENLL